MLSDFIKGKIVITEDTSLGALAIGGILNANNNISMSEAVDVYDELKIQKSIIDYFSVDKDIDVQKLIKLASEIGISYDEVIKQICKIMSSIFAEGDWNLKDKVPVDPKELEAGIQHELEHGPNLLIARKLSIDHLTTEDPKYYSKLEQAGL